MEQVVRPVTVLIVGIVPAIIGPVLRADDQVRLAISIKIGEVPLIGAHLVWMHIAWQRKLHAPVKARRQEVGISNARCGNHRLAIHIAHACIGHPLADTFARGERWPSSASKHVRAVVRLVRAAHHQIQLAISIVIHGQWPGPESDPQINDEAGVVVRQTLKRLRVGR